MTQEERINERGIRRGREREREKTEGSSRGQRTSDEAEWKRTPGRTERTDIGQCAVG